MSASYNILGGLVVLDQVPLHMHFTLFYLYSVFSKNDRLLRYYESVDGINFELNKI